MSLMLSILAWIFAKKLSTCSCEFKRQGGLCRNHLNPSIKGWRKWPLPDAVCRKVGEKTQQSHLEKEPMLIIWYQRHLVRVFAFLPMMSTVRPLQRRPRYVTRYIRTRNWDREKNISQCADIIFTSISTERSKTPNKGFPFPLIGHGGGGLTWDTPGTLGKESASVLVPHPVCRITYRPGQSWHCEVYRFEGRRQLPLTLPRGQYS